MAPKKKAVKKVAAKPKVGAPTKYKQEYAEMARKLCLLGKTDEELADFFGIAVSTLNLWKKSHPEFMESIKKGKDVADVEIVESLHKRAKGYQYDETTFEKIDTKVDGVEEDDDIKLEVYKKKVVTKEVAPDTTAAIFWLKNRQAKKWKDKQDVEHSGTIGQVTVFELPDNGRDK
ncbi:MAG: hypothetical protein BGO31_14285 [Bacteroidetes bacterium 43-16]|nr:MAG: hypothetical protein BGO31_14285 [Bacteroidetes bacterium 43-16]